MRSIKIDDQEILKRLESKRSKKNLKAYLRSGANEKTFGVSLSNIRKIAQAVVSQNLSEDVLLTLCRKLWISGYTEAKMMAIILCPNNQTNIKELNQNADAIDFYPLADLFVDEVIMRSRWAVDLMQEWKLSEMEYKRRCAYRIMKWLAESAEDYAGVDFQEELYLLEKNLPSSANWAKTTMYDALLAIGKRNRRLNTVALAVLKRMGPLSVELSPGETKKLYAEKLLGDRKLQKSLKE